MLLFKNIILEGEIVFDSRYKNSSYDCSNNLTKSVNIPIELYESLKGEYFIGYADNLSFGNGTSVWARLYNPYNLGKKMNLPL